jgi:hypothetical protein
MAMAGSEPRYHYSVVRDVARPGYADVALIRSSEPHGVMEHLRHRERRDVVVLHHRTFRPLLELAQLETYAAQLERTAGHANNGTLGCFVETQQRADGIVRIALYERWFDGEHLHCEQLASRDFDASHDSAVVASAEFLAELREWAERRNDERHASELDAAAEDAARVQRASERSEAAAQLARILAGLNEQA